ncbi:NAD(P)/FAD-dependent oxidoreductase [Halobium palmae]|uniref:NAD(P)/FAD-dependent oxidoreductase n=1 Tax=Halobium palmae TaxID=1776492 RepID=A0ABD5RWB3_9EURY
MSAKHFEVVVIGGGAIGAGLAHSLADRGVDTALFEADHLGAGSTVRSAGGIRQQFSDDRKTRLAMESRRLFDEYAAAAGDAFDVCETGYMFLAQTDAEADGFREDATHQRALGLDVDLLEPMACADRVPGLKTDDLVLGKYCPTDCVTDPGAVTRWLGERAASMGVRVSEDEPVIDVHTDGAGGDVTAVETPEATYGCDAVVDAAGVWAAHVAATVGVEIPITPARVQLAFTAEEPVPADAPFVVDIHERRYFRPADNGRTMFGGANVHDEAPVDPTNYDTEYDEAFVEQTVSFARKRLTVGDVSIEDGWAGLKGLTPDGDPLVGEVDAVPGFYLAAGCNGHGFMLAPALGRALARRLDTGEWGDIDLDPYDPDRFDGDDDGTEDAGFMGVS